MSSIVQRIAREKQREIASRKAKEPVRKENIYELMARVSPHLIKPIWMQPYIDELESTVNHPVNCIIHYHPQCGKAIGDDEPILTKSGWKRVGEVNLKDYLLGSDGSWTKILGVYPQGEIDLYNVEFDDRTKLSVSGDHIWTVIDRNGYKKASNPRGLRRLNKTTNELAENLLGSPNKLGSHRANYQIPIICPIQFPQQKLPMDPYILGYWLGNGNSSQFYTIDNEIVQYIGSKYQISTLESKHKSENCVKFSVLGLSSELRKLGVLNDKNIPDVYLYGSIEDRLALIQGLCDSDGTVNKTGTRQSFANGNPNLVSGFEFLINSLGGVARTRIKKQELFKFSGKSKARRANGDHYEVSFRLPEGMNGFRLKRKLERLRPWNPRQLPRRFIRSIKKIGTGKATCFSVAAKDKLFAAGKSLTLTHNTQTTLHALLWYCLYHPGKNHAYTTFSITRSREVMKEFIDLCVEAGVECTTADGMVTVGKTKIKFGTCQSGQLTGYSITGLHIMDDLLSDLKEASSKVTLDDRWNWFLSVAQTRRHKNTSNIMLGTRWAEQDPSGRAIEHFKGSKNPYRYIRVAAICDSLDDPLGRELGEPMAPDYRSEDWYDDIKLNPRVWSALYQGNPKPTGDVLFATDPIYYDQFPEGPYQNIYGADLAYTAKTRADWSVLIHGRLYTTKNSEGQTLSRKIYLVNMIREQVQMPVFTALMKTAHDKVPGTILWFCSTTELGAAQLMQKDISGMKGVLAKGDKLVRATPVAEKLWIPGDILLPSSASWLNLFLAEVGSFNGQPGGHDDIVDALTALGHLVLRHMTVSTGVGDMNKKIQGIGGSNPNRMSTTRI